MRRDYEVSQAIKFGADVVTILGVAEDASIKGAVEEAHKHGKQLLVDMIAVQDLEKRAKELDEMALIISLFILVMIYKLKDNLH